MSEDSDPRREIGRLRAALGASADRLLGVGVDDPEALMVSEVRFLAALNTEAQLLAFWRDMRNRALARAADLPANEASLTLLRERLRDDDQAAGSGRGTASS